MKARLALSCTSILIALGAVVNQAAAQYPERPVRALVPAAAGDGADSNFRIVADQVAAQLGKSIVVENRPGAGGTIAAREVARASPDGYTLLLGTNASQIFGPLLYTSAGYDSVQSFMPIARLTRTPMVMLVPTSLGVNDLAGFLNLARGPNAPLHYASGGAGTLMHVAAEILQRATNVPLIHVPYKGASPGLIDLTQGRVAMIFVPVNSSFALVEAGKVKVLFVADEQRLTQLPNVPTAAEAGLPRTELVAWTGVFAPDKTPSAIVVRLAQEFTRALANPVVVEVLQRRGADPSPQRGEVFAQFIGAEVARYRDVLKGIKPE